MSSLPPSSSIHSPVPVAEGYEVAEMIGRGGAGMVWRATQEGTLREVALKFLAPWHVHGMAGLRFAREVEIMASLEHENVVRVYGSGESANGPWLAMELIDGPAADAWVKENDPPLRARVELFRGICAGVRHAHQRGVIHRDVKPGNILIDRKGTARLLDMGLARFFQDHTDQLTIKYDDKIVLGTADYVAPEQVANSHSVDIRADIYGLGATFYFLLAGHPPFPTGTVSQKLLWHRTKEPTPLRQIRPEIPEGLAAIVSKMMAKDLKGRYQTPAQVVADLEGWIPAEVPLPGTAEMPQLSLAATEVVTAEPSHPELPPVPAPRPEPARVSKSVAVAERNVPPAAKPAAPFASPLPATWAAASSQPAMPLPKKPSPQAAIDTASGDQRTPTGSKSRMAVSANPFAGGDVSEKPEVKSRWVVIGVGVAAAVAAFAAVKFLM